ncbi:NADPH-dependent FMN reductase-like [Sesbania bispinosa]|nr:NADPH-dependent FMN reductase-like [Sesbania bispinosa]
MAREVIRGAAAVEGVETTLCRVPEMLSDRILEKMKAPPKPNDVSEIMPELLVEADGFIFGFPSHFGMMPSRLKAFFDASGKLWAGVAKNAVENFIAGVTTTV